MRDTEGTRIPCAGCLMPTRTETVINMLKRETDEGTSQSVFYVSGYLASLLDRDVPDECVRALALQLGEELQRWVVATAAELAKAKRKR